MKVLDRIYQRECVREGGLFPLIFLCYGLISIAFFLGRELLSLYGLVLPPSIFTERLLITVLVVIPASLLIAVIAIDSRRGYGNGD